MRTLGLVSGRNWSYGSSNVKEACASKVIPKEKLDAHARASGVMSQTLKIRDSDQASTPVRYRTPPQ